MAKKSKTPESTLILNDDEPNREELFIHNLFVCQSTTEAALKAGYSESYSKSTARYRLKNPKFLDKVREYARAHDLIESAPKLIQLENKCLAQLNKLDGQDLLQSYSKFAPIIKQKKQIAGLLQQDVAPQQPTISIESVQNLMLNVSSNADSLPGKQPEMHKPLITQDKQD